MPEPQPALVLRRPAPADEAQVRGAARELAVEGFDFAPLLDDLAWPDWLATMADREAGLHLPEGIVRRRSSSRRSTGSSSAAARSGTV